MPVEFLGMGATNDGTETHPRSGAAFDPEYTVALARAHEEAGWDRVLTAYGSGSPDPGQAAALIACRTERLQVLVAHRPNVSYPTFAAKTIATLDAISGGRTTVHVITGGNDHEQQREGDTLPKDRRYDRTREAIQIFKKAWTSREPFDFHGEHYRFTDFVLDVEPVQKPRPRISFGGSSPAAYQVGAEEADIYALWGEPLAGTAEQIRTITELAAAAGRPAPTFQVAFRPILGRTEDEAWEKAYATVARIQDRTKGGAVVAHPPPQAHRPGERRLAAAARDRRAGRAARPGAVDGHREGDRRRRQLHRAGRHARDGRRRAAGLLRPRRADPVGPRLRPAGGREGVRPRGHPAGPRRGRKAGRGGARVGAGLRSAPDRCMAAYRQRPSCRQR